MNSISISELLLCSFSNSKILATHNHQRHSHNQQYLSLIHSSIAVMFLRISDITVSYLFSRTGQTRHFLFDNQNTHTTGVRSQWDHTEIFTWYNTLKKKCCSNFTAEEILDNVRKKRTLFFYQRFCHYMNKFCP